MAELTLYGIPTCDTCRKARRALEADGHVVVLRDVRAEPLSDPEWTALVTEFGAALVNRRSATFRGLPEDALESAPRDLLREHPTVMKRPVLRAGDTMTLGWSEATRAAWR